MIDNDGGEGKEIVRSPGGRSAVDVVIGIFSYLSKVCDSTVDYQIFF